MKDEVRDVLPKTPPVITGVRGYHRALAGGAAQPAWQHRRASARLSRYAAAHGLWHNSELKPHRMTALRHQPDFTENQISPSFLRPISFTPDIGLPPSSRRSRSASADAGP